MRGRSTSDLMILMVAGTVCATILGIAGTVAFIEIKTSGHGNTTQVQGALGNVINTLIGLMAGFVAGRTKQMRGKGSSTDDVGDE